MPLLFVVVSTLLLLSTVKINRADLNGVIDRESFLVKYFVRNAVQNLLFASGAEERSEAVLILQLDKIFEESVIELFIIVGGRVSFVVVYARTFVPRERSYGNAQSLRSHNLRTPNFYSPSYFS